MQEDLENKSVTLVINSGKVTGIVDGRTAKKEEIGLLMTKTDFGKEAAANG